MRRLGLIVFLAMLFFMGYRTPALGQLPEIKSQLETIIGNPINTTAGNPPTLAEFLTLFRVKRCPTYNMDVTSSCVDATDAQKNFAYSVFKIPLSSPGYKNLLFPTASPNPITVYIYLSDLSPCWMSGGAAWTSSDIRLKGYWETYNNSACGKLSMRESMIHESGHILRQRSPRIGQAFKSALLSLPLQESQCYDRRSYSDGPYIKTYAYRCPGTQSGDYCGGGGYVSESLAETIGMNAVCGPRTTCGKFKLASVAITDWPHYCDKTYGWTKSNVYGNVDFFQ